MVVDKICKMTVNGVKSKSESFFSISHGLLELWRRNLRGGVDSWIGLRLQISAKEMFNHLQFFSTYKRYVKIKLMQNKTNLWNIFLLKTK